MKFFMKKEQKAPKTDVPDAIRKNRETIDMLEKRQKFLESKIHKAEEEARDRVRKKDKRGALLLLKQKKMYEGQLDQLANSIVTLTQQITTLEGASTQSMAVNAMATGVQAQKAANEKLNLDKIDQLVDDMQDLQDQQQEISQALSAGQNLQDDEELLEELGRLQADDLESQLTEAPVPSGMPAGLAGRVASGVAAPTAAPAAATSSAQQMSEDDQLAALQAELA
eukprot:Filipodium_phascolosomae@DN2096_c0_g1_i1.p1